MRFCLKDDPILDKEFQVVIFGHLMKGMQIVTGRKLASDYYDKLIGVFFVNKDDEPTFREFLAREHKHKTVRRYLKSIKHDFEKVSLEQYVETMEILE